MSTQAPAPSFIMDCVSRVSILSIDHFTVVYSVAWPLNGSEAGGDLVFVQTSLLLLNKLSSNAN